MTKPTTTTVTTTANLLPETICQPLLESLANEAPSTLPYRFVSVQGPQALQALQGQVSCDLNKLATDEFSFGTANTPKGRMYALFRVTPWREGFLLCLGETVVDAFVAQISKYLHFFKCEIQHEPDMQAVLCEQSSSEQNQHANIEASWPLAQLPCVAHNLEERWVSASDIDNTSDLWPAYQCALGIPELYPETLEHYILQQLNLQKLKAVSFKKGCYTGQEIIARIKFLGKQKTQSYILYGDQMSSLAPKSKLYDADGNALGELVRMHASKGASFAIGHLNIAYAQAHTKVYLDDAAKLEMSIYSPSYL